MHMVLNVFSENSENFRKNFHLHFEYQSNSRNRRTEVYVAGLENLVVLTFMTGNKLYLFDFFFILWLYWRFSNTEIDILSKIHLFLKKKFYQCLPLSHYFAQLNEFITAILLYNSNSGKSYLLYYQVAV